jgi:hypothetical protein
MGRSACAACRNAAACAGKRNITVLVLPETLGEAARRVKGASTARAKPYCCTAISGQRLPDDISWEVLALKARLDRGRTMTEGDFREKDDSAAPRSQVDLASGSTSADAPSALACWKRALGTT